MATKQRTSDLLSDLGHLKTQVLVILAVCLLFIATSVHAKSITLNLKNADISALIKTVADITGKNFVVDPRVKGKVTVISSHPMEQNEIYQVFLSILEVHGFSAVPTGNLIKIIPEVKAKQLSIPVSPPEGAQPDDQMITRIVQVKNISAAQLVPILRPLVPQQGHLAAYPSTNVLILSDRAGNVRRLVKIINRIDQASDNSIEIIPLHNAAASDIVRVLNSLLKKTGKGAAGGAKVTLAADDRTNSILMSGDQNERLRLKSIISHLDVTLADTGNTHVIYLRYAKAKDLVTVLTGVSSSIGKKTKTTSTTSSALGNKVGIQADESSNTLIITAPTAIYRSLKAVIAQLDIRRAQVLIEAIIVEISLDKFKELGVQWIVDGRPGGNGPVGIVKFGTPGIDSIANAISGKTNPGFLNGATLGFGKFDSSSVNFAAILTALASDSSSNILSTPSLMTLDNEEAEIIVGQNVPFVTGSFANTGAAAGAANPFQTIQREDVGLTLRVTPQINEGNAVQLNIEQEISSIAPSALTGASDIITNKRSIKTTVIVEDGQVIVLGGLIKDDVQESVQKVPGLGDIPLLGKLFRYNKTTKTKTNLMVFIHPVIVRDAATETMVTTGKYNYMRARQQEIRNKGMRFLSANEMPILPKHFPEIPNPFASDNQPVKNLPAAQPDE
ncbi:MAG TPA: type II secretion system protein GspD [Gammaproteobacteria bacterium]|nr:type II secretion system protein GspD [Gammaproteobacteria bacterium]